ncbi:HNH endonuclease [Sorangium sp. So ce131]|uniref:HNH endonuclease n=1 Tax=Sorangium sp. So ce131 TaxID=3133282 RepID=UPI003F5FA14C
MIARALRDLVRTRAARRCEYCGLRQELVPLVAFHIEHIVPRQHGGGDGPENLALACYHCNLHKGPNLTGIDPATGAVVPLFNPRLDAWGEHFSVEGAVIVGRTPTARATARVLSMNSPTRIELRTELGARS